MKKSEEILKIQYEHNRTYLFGLLASILLIILGFFSNIEKILTIKSFKILIILLMIIFYSTSFLIITFFTVLSQTNKKFRSLMFSLKKSKTKKIDKKQEHIDKNIWIGFILVILIGLIPFLVTTPIKNLLDKGTISLIEMFWIEGILGIYFVGALSIWIFYTIGKIGGIPLSRNTKNFISNFFISYTSAFLVYTLTREEYRPYIDNTLFVFFWTLVSIIYATHTKEINKLLKK